LIDMTQVTHSGTSVVDTIRAAVDHTSADRVFGTPVSHDGVTVLPVAKIGGGGGGGGGTGPASDGHETGGTGGGMGVAVKPLGVYVLKEGSVGWRPTIDINKVIIGGQIVAVVALFTVRALIKARERRVEP
jgi:uncharacterized spore protein YtfJ